MPEEKPLTSAEQEIEEASQAELKKARKELYLIVMSTGAVRTQEQLMIDYDLNYKQGIFTHIFNLTTRQLYIGDNQWKDIPQVVFTIPETAPPTNGEPEKGTSAEGEKK